MLCHVVPITFGREMKADPKTLLAILAFACGVAACGQDVEATIAGGDSLLMSGDVKRAMALFNDAVERSPSAATYTARARGWYYDGKESRSAEDLDRALDLDSLYPRANYQVALFAFRNADYAAVVRFCDIALHTPTDDVLKRHVLVLRGQGHAALGHNKQAIADLEEGLGKSVDDIPAIRTLAALYDGAGDYAASLELQETLCTVEPEDIGNWSNRGFELNKLGRYEEALPVLDHALRMDKDQPIVLSNKAYALAKLGRDDEAFTLVQRSLKSQGADAYALRTRGLLYLRKGDRLNACKDLTLSKALGNIPEVDELIKEYCSGMER